MADKIIRCDKLKGEADALVAYVFIYEVEHPTDLDARHTFNIHILPADLIDPEDENEAATKANIKALAQKNIWISTLSSEEEVTLAGDVTL